MPHDRRCSIPDLVAVSGGKISLQPHAGQLQTWDSKRRFTFAIAGTQSGKTSFGPWWLYRAIQEQGAGDYLAVTATYDLFKLKMLPEMLRVFTQLMRGWEWHKSERVLYRPADDTRIILRSANVPEALESATAKAAWLDECGQDTFRLEAWEAVQRRLSLSEGPVLGTTTPYNLGWLKSEVYDRWRNGDSDFQVVQFKSLMNPHFPRAEYDRMKDKMPDWKFRMFYDGDFTRPAGLIYSDVDEQIHYVKRFGIPPEWPRYVGIDPGAVNTAILWIAENPETHCYTVYDVTLEGGKTTKQHAAAALEKVQGKNVVAWALGAKSEIQQRMDWQEAGVPVREPVIIDVEAGIDRVIRLLKEKRLFVFDDLRGLRDELGTYSRELDAAGQVTEKIKDKETFHRLDALRYCVQLVTEPAGVYFA